MDDETVAFFLQDRGGRLQQGECYQTLGEDGMELNTDAGDCPLARVLLNLWGWGLLSAPNLQWIASASKLSGASSGDLDKLASIGASGLYHNNMRRDLIRAFCAKATVPRPVLVEVHALDKLNSEVVVSQSVLNICEVMEAIWNEHNDKYAELMGEHPRDCWSSLEEDDPRLQHLAPLREESDWMDISYPVAVHGDGGVYARAHNSSILTISMKSILSETFSGNIIPMMVLPKDIRSREEGANTADEMFDLVVHF